MKKIFICLVIGLILLMVIGIVFAETREDSIKENLEKIGKEVDNITKISDGFFEVGVVGEEKPVFAIMYSSEETKVVNEETVIQDKRQFLNFGFSGEMSESGFLKTSTGVGGDLNKGYVMMRAGSITGISTNLNVLKKSNLGQIEIIIYKNEKAIGFGNILNSVSLGMKKDYDLQSKDTVIFEPGDIISIYVKSQGDIFWKDVTTMIEITTLD